MAFKILDLAARLLLALGVGCLLLAGFLAWHTLAFSPGTASATGEVVSYRELRDGDDTRLRPRIKFKTVTGEIVNPAISSAVPSRGRRTSRRRRPPCGR